MAMQEPPAEHNLIQATAALRRALAIYRRRVLEARDAGVPVVRIAQIIGHSREHVRQLLKREQARRNAD